MKSPAFLCVHANRELYGSDRVFLQTLRALRKHWPDAHITVLLPGDGPLMQAARDITPDIRISDLFVLRRSRLRNLLAELPRLLGNVREARRLMSEYNVTYISTIVMPDFILASRLGKAKSVIHVHELPTGAARIVFSSLLWLSKASLVFISEQCRRSFIGLSGKRHEVIWNGAQRQELSPIPLAAGDELRVLLIGRFNAWKGQGLLIDAVDKLSDAQRASVKVRLVGSVFEDQEHFLEAILGKIARHGLQNTIEVLPFDPEPQRHYEWANVVAVPSIKPEPFGLVAIEAMASGRAVMAADHGGLSEIVVNEVTGLKVIPGDMAAWTQAIRRYLHDPELAMAHGRAGRQRFAKHFDEATYMRRIADVVRTVLTARCR